MTHKTYRKIVTDTGVVLYPVRKDGDILTWDSVEGIDHGFVCFCGHPITSFADALALADRI